MAQAAAGFLTATQNPDGGWGYTTGGISLVEPTAAVVLALHGHDDHTRLVHTAADWLQSAQHADGGWGLNQDDHTSGWLTAWAVWALARLNSPNDAVPRGAAWLQQVQSLPASEDAIQQAGAVLEIDPTLQGWPWWPGEASWIEPTALALLALSTVSTHSIDRARRDESIQYLLDRRCRPGGWNVGNPVMFSQSLPPRACPTAWVMLALAQHNHAAITEADIDALRTDMGQDGGALALAWGRLALQAFAHDDTTGLRRLLLLQGANGSWNNNPYHTAIASLALAREPGR